MAITNKNESRNFNATSTIDDTVVMYMNGSYNTNSEELTFNQSIRNLSAYKEHKEEVDGDFESWKGEIEDAILGNK